MTLFKYCTQFHSTGITYQVIMRLQCYGIYSWDVAVLVKKTFFLVAPIALELEISCQMSLS